MRLVERLFRGNKKAAAELESVLKSLLIPFETIGWDHYDNSVELYGLPPEFRLSEVQCDRIFKCGFGTIFANHTDKWETHYHSGKNHAIGWRVSYPHKRGPEAKCIWVEKLIDGWPKEWFETGYVIIVPQKERS